jgi:hypothetical protein
MSKLKAQMNDKTPSVKEKGLIDFLSLVFDLVFKL